MARRWIRAKVKWEMSVQIVIWRKLLSVAVFSLIVLPVLLLGFDEAVQGRTNQKDPQSFDEGRGGTYFVAETLNPGRLDLMKSRILDGTFKKINAVIVLKGGRILAEEYFNGEDRESLHEIRSATKVIGSALLGIAIERGYVSGVEAPLLPYFRDYEPLVNSDDRKERITLEHVLDMTTGLDSNDLTFESKSKGHETYLLQSTDLVKFMLDLPMVAEPGERWAYSTGTSHLLGAVIARATATSVQDFAKTHLFDPMGIAEYSWKVDQGWAHTGGGFRMRAIDMAKFGQLFLQGGVWEGRQLIPGEWVRESAASRIQVSEDLRYGYQWWKTSFPLDRRRVETFFAAGNGGSHIFVFPSLDLVVVTTGSAFGQLYDAPQIRVLLGKFVLPAVTGDPERHDAEPHLRRIPVALLIVCGAVLASAVVLWPAMFIIRRVRERGSNSSRSPGCPPGYLRFLAGVNAFLLALYVSAFVAAAPFFELLLNSGYARPLGPIGLMLGPMLLSINLPITILTIGMVPLAVWTIQRRCWACWERWHFSATTLSAVVVVVLMWRCGLVWLP